MGWWTDFRDSVLKPVATVAAVVYTGGLAADLLFADAVAAGTMSAGMASALGAGVAAGGLTAIQGGDPAQILKSALTAGTVSFIGGQLLDALKGGGVSQASIDLANATTDPVAALNANQGWTQADVSYLSQIGAGSSVINNAIANNASKFNVQPSASDLSIQQYTKAIESNPALKDLGLNATSGTRLADNTWAFKDAAGNISPLDSSGQLLTDQTAMSNAIYHGGMTADQAARVLGIDAGGTVYNPVTDLNQVKAGDYFKVPGDESTYIAGTQNGDQVLAQYNVKPLPADATFADRVAASRVATSGIVDSDTLNIMVNNAKNMGYSDTQILKALGTGQPSWMADLRQFPPDTALSELPQQTVGAIGTGGTSTSVYNPATGMTETTTPGTGTNPVASVSLNPGDTTGGTTTPTTPINPAIVAGGAGAVLAGAGGGAGGATTTPGTTTTPPGGTTTPPANNLPPVEDLSGTGTPGTNNPLGNGDQTLAGGVGSWTAAQLESLGLGGMSATQILGLMAAGALAPSVLQALGLIKPTTTAKTSYGPLDYTPLPAFEKTDLAQPGLNPGLIPIQPYYETTNPTQAQYYWGKAPYIGTAADVGKLQNIPGAPAQAWGHQTSIPQFDVNKFIQQTITPQQSQALAGAGGQYQIAGGAPVQQAAPVIPVHQAMSVMPPDERMMAGVNLTSLPSAAEVQQQAPVQVQSPIGIQQPPMVQVQSPIGIQQPVGPIMPVGPIQPVGPTQGPILGPDGLPIAVAPHEIVGGITPVIGTVPLPR